MSDVPHDSSSDCSAVATIEPMTGPDASSEVADRRFRVVAIVAGVLLAPQVIAHVLIPLFILPTFKEMFSSMGGTLPLPTAILVAVGPWLAPLLILVDVGVFWGFYQLARRYWIGLLFAPLFTSGLFVAPLIWALYLPSFEVITLIK